MSCAWEGVTPAQHRLSIPSTDLGAIQVQCCQKLPSSWLLLPAGIHSNSECVKLVEKCPLQIYQLQCKNSCLWHRDRLEQPAADTQELHLSLLALLQRGTQQKLNPRVKRLNPTNSQLQVSMTSKGANSISHVKMELKSFKFGLYRIFCPLHAQPNNWINLFYSLTGYIQSQDVSSANLAQIQTQEDTAPGLTWSGSVTIPPNSLWISLQLRKAEAGYKQELMPNKRGNLHALHGMASALGKSWSGGYLQIFHWKWSFYFSFLSLFFFLIAFFFF